MQGTDPLSLILDHAHEGFVSMGSDGRVLLWNRAAESLFGWSADEARGRLLAELIIPERLRQAHIRGLDRYLATGEGRMVNRRVELDALHRSGRELPIELTIAPSAAGESGAIEFNAFMHDISDRRRSVEGELAVAGIVNASDAVVAMDHTGTVLTWNPGAERLYGYSADEAVGRTMAHLCVPGEPDACDAVDDAIRTHRATPRLMTRERRKDGTVVDVSLAISPLTGPGGEVKGVSVVARDVTEMQEARRELDTMRRWMQKGFQKAPIGMCIIRSDGTYLAVNDSLCRTLARTRDELLTMHTLDAVAPDDLELAAQKLESLIAGEVEESEFEARGRLPDGTTIWLDVRVAGIRDESDAVESLICQVQEITERKEAEERLRDYGHHLNRLSVRDSLTGLPNEHDFGERLDDQLAGAGPEDICSLVLFDVDRFGRLNNIKGQVEGDRVLKQVGEALTELSRGDDLVARVGADEFALMLPSTPRAGAIRAAERVEATVAEHADGATLSWGVAVWPQDGKTAPELLTCADTALGDARPAPEPADDPRYDPELTRILDLACEQLGMDVAMLVRIGETHQTFEAISGDSQQFGIDLSTEIPLEDAMLTNMLLGELPLVVPDAMAEPSLQRFREAGASGPGSYVATELELGPGHARRALSVIDCQPRPLGERETGLMRFLARLVADRIHLGRERQTVERANVELAGIHALLSALGARDHYTGEHSTAVVRLATAVARNLGMDDRQLREVEQVALLHDIGKVGIPDSVLQKRGPLDEQEWELMREHPAIGSRIVSATPHLSHLAPAVRAEHERFDGRGYPDRLAGQDIPLASRIVFACDAYHAMTSDRPYRAAMPESEALKELRDGAGGQFDPAVVGALLGVIQDAAVR